MKGKICDWKDDKGFGFIISENQSDKIFFHISDIEKKERRPKVGDIVNFDLTQDNQKRIKAKHVSIKGFPSRKNSSVNQSNIEPVKKNLIDYIAITIFLLSASIGGFIFYETKDLSKLIPFGVIAIITIGFLSRQKKPKEKNFTCARCKVSAEFDKRTIEAWNKGVLKIYCSACHQQWLSTQPEIEQPIQFRGSRSGCPEIEQPIQFRGSRSGCLGVFAILVILPLMALISVHSWLS